MKIAFTKKEWQWWESESYPPSKEGECCNDKCLGENGSRYDADHECCVGCLGRIAALQRAEGSVEGAENHNGKQYAHKHEGEASAPRSQRTCGGRRDRRRYRGRRSRQIARRQRSVRSRSFLDDSSRYQAHLASLRTSWCCWAQSYYEMGHNTLNITSWRRATRKLRETRPSPQTLRDVIRQRVVRSPRRFSEKHLRQPRNNKLLSPRGNPCYDGGW
jgi:hypothetical protein